MGIIIFNNNNFQMTAIPCILSIPATACDAMKSTISAVSSVDKDAKSIITMTIAAPNVTDKDIKALKEDPKNTDGTMWATTSSADGLTGTGSLWSKAAGKWAAPVNVGWKCGVNQITQKEAWKADAKAFAAACKGGDCTGKKAMEKKNAADKCEVDTNAIKWNGGAMTADAKTGVSMSMVASASADGKAANTWNLGAKYSAMMGGYYCTKDCKAVTLATYSGWFEIAVTAAGATTLAASAAVATAALMF